MARIRTIKPEFFRHEGLQDLEAANPGAYVMLVFAGLWGHCDKEGRFRWRPRTLKLDILPFLDFDLGASLVLLREAGLVRQYEIGGELYGEVPTFKEHQRLSGKEAQEPPKHPAPNGFLNETPEGSNGEATGKQSPAQEGKGREGKGREDTPPSGGPSSDRYRWQGHVIRLTEPDFNRWRDSFRFLDLPAELESLDAWLASPDATESNRKRWFHVTAGALKNRNADAKAKGRASSSQARKSNTVNTPAGEHPYADLLR